MGLTNTATLGIYMAIRPVIGADAEDTFPTSVVLALWVALSCVWVELASWRPDPTQGVLGYLKPVPAFGTLSIAFMFAIDWCVCLNYLTPRAVPTRAPSSLQVEPLGL